MLTNSDEVRESLWQRSNCIKTWHSYCECNRNQENKWGLPLAAGSYGLIHTQYPIFVCSCSKTFWAWCLMENLFVSTSGFLSLYPFFSYTVTLMAWSSCPSHAHSIKYVHGLIPVAYFVNLSHVKYRFVVLLNVIFNMANLVTSDYIQIDSRWMFCDLLYILFITSLFGFFIIRYLKHALSNNADLSVQCFLFWNGVCGVFFNWCFWKPNNWGSRSQ